MERKEKRIALPSDFYFPDDESLEKEAKDFEKDPVEGLYIQTLKGDVPLYREREGDNFIRILPPLKSPILKWWAGIYYYHFLPSSDRVVCPAMTFGKGRKCLVCEWRKTLQAVNPRLAKRLYPIKRGLVWVIDVYDAESLERGVQLLDASYKKLILGIVNACRNKRTGKLVRIESPENGRIISYVRENKMINIDGRDVNVPEYTGIKMEEETLEIFPDWLEAIKEYGPFHELLNIPDESIVEELILGFKDVAEDTDVSRDNVFEKDNAISESEKPVDVLNERKKDESANSDEEPFCFGDASVFNPASADCMDCKHFVACAKKVKESMSR